MVEELSTTVVDGRVQRTGLFDQQTLAIEIYASGRRHHLVATTGGPEPALYRTEAEYAADPSIVTPFALLLRKHVRGGTVAAIDQPALDRVIRLSKANMGPQTVRIWETCRLRGIQWSRGARTPIRTSSNSLHISLCGNHGSTKQSYSGQRRRSGP
jgi:NFACT N-terminal and middle domains